MSRIYRKGITKLNERYFRLSAREYTIYVEGDKDILFWNEIFPKNKEWTPRVEILQDGEGNVIGGWLNLINYLETKIKQKSKINFIIAIDGDYNEINHCKKEYKNVVMTSKYSFENYIFCPNSINRCMNILSYGLIDDSILVEDKLNKFAKIIKNLIILDCINNKENLGLSIYDLNNTQLTNFKKIKNYVKQISKEHNDLIQKNINILDEHNLIDYIRWKVFLKKLLSIINNEVNIAIDKENNKRVNNKIRKLKKRTEDELYIYCIKNCSICKGCLDYKNLLLKANNAFDFIVNV